MSSAAEEKEGEARTRRRRWRGSSRLIGELREGGRIPPPAPWPPTQSQSQQSQRFHPLMPSALLYGKGKVAWRRRKQLRERERERERERDTYTHHAM